MTLAIKVHGVQDTLAAFGEIPRAVGNMNMRVAMNAGAGIIRDEAVANIKSRSGLLAKSMKIRVKVPDASFNTAHHGRPAYAVIGPSRNVAGIQTYRKTGRLGKIKALRVKRKGRIESIVGRSLFGSRVATNLIRPSRYAHLVEKGTKAHKISAKSARVLAMGELFRRTVQHPGTSAKRFMSRAVQSAGPQAQTKIIDKLRQGLGEWAARRAVRALAA